MLERGRPELQWRTILAGVAGNVMEWYDFSVYGYFAAVPGRVSFVYKKRGRDPGPRQSGGFGHFR